MAMYFIRIWIKMAVYLNWKFVVVFEIWKSNVFDFDLAELYLILIWTQPWFI